MGNASRHCWGDPQALVNPHEIVMHEMDRDRMGVILGLFWETVAQARKPPHRHAHGQILALNVARRDVLRVRVSGAAERLSALNLRRAISPCRMNWPTTENRN